MRGKESRRSMELATRRITPAYAGKRDRRLSRKEHSQDHPRVCGEKDSDSVNGGRMSGSPPRMRGKGADGKGFAFFKGITPAYAGKSLPINRRKNRRWDHPRVCGEKAIQSVIGKLNEGSPPRMRGKALTATATVQQFRITPAYAGKSF